MAITYPEWFPKMLQDLHGKRLQDIADNNRDKSYNETNGQIQLPITVDRSSKSMCKQTHNVADLFEKEKTYTRHGLPSHAFTFMDAWNK